MTSLCLEITDDKQNHIDHDDRKLLSIDHSEPEHEQTKLRHWRESFYATGLVEPTWSDEWEVYRRKKKCCDWGCCGCIYPSAVVCSWLGAGRIGNMAVLKERYIMVEIEDEDEENLEQVNGFVDEDDEEGKPSQIGNKTSNTPTLESAKPAHLLVRKHEIQFIVGPFWPLLIFITYPLIFGMSAFTLIRCIPGKPLGIQILWVVLTLQLIRSLFNTGFRDPGIVPRRTRLPPTRERRNGLRLGKKSGEWKWDDQVQAYRPKNSTYCSDCKVVVEDFDHT